MAKSETPIREMNEVIIRGTVVHVFSANRWTSTTIAVSGRNNHRNYPEVHWYDENAEKAKELKEGDRITIKGTLQSSRKYRNIYVVGTEFIETPRELEEIAGINKGPYLRDYSMFCLKGILLRRYLPDDQDRKVAYVTLKTIVGDRSYFPQLVCFRNAIRDLDSIEDGQTVCVKGYVQTDKKEHDGETRHYQSYVVEFLTSI